MTRLRLLVGGVAVGWIATVAVLGFAVPWKSTTGHLDFLDMVVRAAVGFVWVAVGLAIWYWRPANRIGIVMTAAGFTWFLPNLASIDHDVTFTLGWYVRVLIFAPLVYLLIAFPSGTLKSRLDLGFFFVFLAYAAVAALPFLFTWHPLDWGCSACPENLLVWHRDAGLSAQINHVSAYVFLWVGVATAAVVFHHWLSASPYGRRLLGPVLYAGVPVILGYFVLANILHLIYYPAGPGQTIDTAFTAILALLPISVLAGLLADHLRRAAVGDLLVDLGGVRPASATHMRQAVARALRDPTADIVFKSAGSTGYVDSLGVSVPAPRQSPARAVTPVGQDEDALAFIVHDPALKNHSELLDAVAAVAYVAIEKDLLHEEVKARLEEVRASRARLVQIGDVERQRIERDLHDGAQQRLVSLALTLQMAQAQLDARRHAVLAQTLAEAVGEARSAVSELRQLAQGVHPAILTREGLVAAVETLADRSPLRARIVADNIDRLPATVEGTAYYIVAEALANVAKHAQASSVVISLQQSDGTLSVSVTDDGIGGADASHGTGIRGIADRVAVLDGRLVVQSAPGKGTSVHAEMPCKS